jgi:hypothetical protein
VKREPKDSIIEDRINLEDIPKNNVSIFKNLPTFIAGSMFKLERSFAQFRLSEPKTICSFGPNNTIIVLSSSGKYYQASIDMKKGGECETIQESNFVSEGK